MVHALRAASAATAVALAAAVVADFNTWTLVGSASRSSSTTMALTNGINQANAAWAPDTLPTSQPWTVNFTVTMSSPVGLGADGITFLVHTDTRGRGAVGSLGSALGVLGASTAATVGPSAGLYIRDYQQTPGVRVGLGLLSGVTTSQTLTNYWPTQQTIGTVTPTSLAISMQYDPCGCGTLTAVIFNTAEGTTSTQRTPLDLKEALAAGGSSEWPVANMLWGFTGGTGTSAWTHTITNLVYGTSTLGTCSNVPPAGTCTYATFAANMDSNGYDISWTPGVADEVACRALCCATRGCNTYIFYATSDLNIAPCTIGPSCCFLKWYTNSLTSRTGARGGIIYSDPYAPDSCSDFTAWSATGVSGFAKQTTPSYAVITRAQTNEANALWAPFRVPLAARWNASFVASVSSASGGGADGFAFVVSGDSRGRLAVGDSGSAVGVSAASASNSINGVGLWVLDYQNTVGLRAGMGATSITSSALASAASSVTTTTPTWVYVTVTYDPCVSAADCTAAGMLTATIYHGATGATSTLTSALSIANSVTGTAAYTPYAFVGFTGGTGGAWFEHRISRFAMQRGAVACPSTPAGSQANFGGWRTIGSPAISSANCAILTQSVGSLANAIWAPTPIPAGYNWFASFNVSLTNPYSGGADGLAFVLQSSAAGLAAIGGSGGAVGAVGITPGIVAAIEDYQGTAGLRVGFGNLTGLASITPLLNSISTATPTGAHVSLQYNAVLATMVLTAIHFPSGASFTRTYAGFDINTILSGANAYYGFTAATGGSYWKQSVTAFTFTAISPSPSPSPSPSVSPSTTRSASVTASVSVTGTVTSSVSPSLSATLSPTLSASVSASLSQSLTMTASPSLSASVSPSATLSASNSLSQSLTASNSISQSLSASGSVSASTTATPSTSRTQSITPSPSVTPSSSATRSMTLSLSASVSTTATISSSVVPSPTPSVSLYSSNSASKSVSASVTASASVSPSRSASLSLTPSRTVSGTISGTVTSSASVTPSTSVSATATSSASPTSSMTASSTVSPTASSSGSATATSSATPSTSMTATATTSATSTSSLSATPTQTPSASVTSTATPSVSSTGSVTATASVSGSPSRSASASGTRTASASVTSTDTASSSRSSTRSPSASASPSVTPISSEAAAALGLQNGGGGNTGGGPSVSFQPASSTPTFDPGVGGAQQLAPGAQQADSGSAVGGGVGGAIAAVIIGIAFVVFYRRRRAQPHSLSSVARKVGQRTSTTEGSVPFASNPLHRFGSGRGKSASSIATQPPAEEVVDVPDSNTGKVRLSLTPTAVRANKQSSARAVVVKPSSAGDEGAHPNGDATTPTGTSRRPEAADVVSAATAAAALDGASIVNPLLLPPAPAQKAAPAASASLPIDVGDGGSIDLVNPLKAPHPTKQQQQSRPKPTPASAGGPGTEHVQAPLLAGRVDRHDAVVPVAAVPVESSAEQIVLVNPMRADAPGASSAAAATAPSDASDADTKALLPRLETRAPASDDARVTLLSAASGSPDGSTSGSSSNTTPAGTGSGAAFAPSTATSAVRASPRSPASPGRSLGAPGAIGAAAAKLAARAAARNSKTGAASNSGPAASMSLPPAAAPRLSTSSAVGPAPGKPGLRPPGAMPLAAAKPATR